MNIDQLVVKIRELLEKEKKDYETFRNQEFYDEYDRNDIVNSGAYSATIKAYEEVLLLLNHLTCCKREV